MAYDITFTLSAAGTTITWLQRPPRIEPNYGIRSAKHPVPGTTHSIRQMLGSDSPSWTFEFMLHDLKMIYSSGVVVAANPRDIKDLLELWARTGLTCVWTADEVTKGAALAGKSVKIIDFSGPEIQGAQYKYNISITLEEYWTG